jgi:hypothetical protein
VRECSTLCSSNTVQQRAGVQHTVQQQHCAAGCGSATI